EQHDRLEEDRDARKPENIERRYQEDQDDEPLDKLAEEFADIEVEACLLGSFMDTGSAECVVEAQNAHDLDYHSIEDDTDDPADKKYDNRSQNGRDVLSDGVPEVVERTLHRTR